MHGPNSLIHLQDLSLPVTVGVLTKSLSVLQKVQLPLLPATGKSRMAVGKKILRFGSVSQVEPAWFSFMCTGVLPARMSV